MLLCALRTCITIILQQVFKGGLVQLRGKENDLGSSKFAKKKCIDLCCKMSSLLKRCLVSARACLTPPGSNLTPANASAISSRTRALTHAHTHAHAGNLQVDRIYPRHFMTHALLLLAPQVCRHTVKGGRRGGSATRTSPRTAPGERGMVTHVVAPGGGGRRRDAWTVREATGCRSRSRNSRSCNSSSSSYNNNNNRNGSYLSLRSGPPRGSCSSGNARSRR